VTFRVTDPATACARIDFSIDPGSGRWRGTPLEQVAGLLTETAQQHVLAMIAGHPLATVLADGVGQIRDQILHGLTTDLRLAETGIAVIGARVVAVRPEPDVEKALRTPAREQMQQEADRATYERRALAVERERAIAENELQNQIELARREEQLVAQRGVNARRQAEESAAASGIEAHARAAREELLAGARAQGTRALGEARAAGEAARVAAYRDVPQAALLGLAAKDLAASLPQIGSVVLAPDLVSSVLARLAAAPSAPLAAPAPAAPAAAATPAAAAAATPSATTGAPGRQGRRGTRGADGGS
jgi:regulator of protease activity HflC (stomatin/prohibitin superfamily)